MLCSCLFCFPFTCLFLVCIFKIEEKEKEKNASSIKIRIETLNRLQNPAEGKKQSDEAEPAQVGQESRVKSRLCFLCDQADTTCLSTLLFKDLETWRLGTDHARARRRRRHNAAVPPLIPAPMLRSQPRKGVVISDVTAAQGRHGSKAGLAASQDVNSLSPISR